MKQPESFVTALQQGVSKMGLRSPFPLRERKILPALPPQGCGCGCHSNTTSESELLRITMATSVSLAISRELTGVWTGTITPQGRGRVGTIARPAPAGGQLPRALRVELTPGYLLPDPVPPSPGSMEPQRWCNGLCTQARMCWVS